MTTDQFVPTSYSQTGWVQVRIKFLPVSKSQNAQILGGGIVIGIDLCINAKILKMLILHISV
jgi:hypothetical protein